MSRKKIWTFDSICRAARRKAKNWHVGPVNDKASWTNTERGVSCALGYCPLGVVFAWGRRKRPDDEWLEEHGFRVPFPVANEVMAAADNEFDENRPRMLKLLGVRVDAETQPKETRND